MKILAFQHILPKNALLYMPSLTARMLITNRKNLGPPRAPLYPLPTVIPAKLAPCGWAAGIQFCLAPSTAAGSRNIGPHNLLRGFCLAPAPMAGVIASNAKQSHTFCHSREACPCAALGAGIQRYPLHAEPCTLYAVFFPDTRLLAIPTSCRRVASLQFQTYSQFFSH